MKFNLLMTQMVSKAISDVITMNARVMQRWPFVVVGKKYGRATLNLKWSVHTPCYCEPSDKILKDIMNEVPVSIIMDSIFGAGSDKDFFLRERAGSFRCNVLH